MPTLYIAVTNHGFGHATRAASIAAEIRRCCGQQGLALTLIMATTAPKWLLDSYLKGDYIHRPVSFDVGVLQSDSLTMDKPATLQALQNIRSQQDALIEAEAAFLQSSGVDLVLADIPPLVAKIAHHASVPCWMMGNFGWDFIYRAWGEEESGFVDISDWIADCCSHADRTFRMPFHSPMDVMPNVTDIGLTGGNPDYSELHLRKLMQREVPSERTVLLTFGGLGLSSIPYAALSQFPDWQFVTFDRQAPDLPNLYRVTDQAMRPVDWMAVCDRVFSKPGYSTFAEACLLDKGVITITREGFAEAQILIDGIQDYASHRIIDAQTFFDGDWSFLTGELSPPKKAEKLNKDGKHTIATEVLNHFKAI
ncbi:MAG: glycosyl transferase [Cyanobacteria bacterium J06634_6]